MPLIYLKDKYEFVIYLFAQSMAQPDCGTVVSAADIAWTDHIFVKEEKHQSRLRAAFPRALQHKLTDSLRDDLS